MSQSIYNNFGICSLGIMSVLQVERTLSLAELLLVFPFISHTQLLKYLARKNFEIKSLEQLIVKNQRWVANFNKRYYSGLVASLNAVQFLHDIELIHWNGKSCSILEDLPYERAMGKRADKIYKASNNIARLISADAANAYTNLRIQL